MNKTNIRGVFFDNISMDEAVAICESRVREKRQCVVFTPNAEIVQLASEDEDFKKLVNSSDLTVPDGAGVILASKILKKPLKEKVAGIELGEKLISRSGQTGIKFFFYGSRPETDEGVSVAELAKRKLLEKYPTAQIVGTNDGYVKEDGMEALIEKINESGADCLFVCLGVPKQEKWIAKNRSRLAPCLILGLGGSLDVFAGEAKRAPKLFIKLNLEWLYRLLREPWRLGRMMSLPKFILSVIFSKKEG